MLARLSTIAQGIDAAAHQGVDVINISAKWPVDSRVIAEAILDAVGGEGDAPGEVGDLARALAPAELDITDVKSSLRSVMWRNVGIERSGERLGQRHLGPTAPERDAGI